MVVTKTAKTQVATFPDGSVAVTVTSVIPGSRQEPDGGAEMTSGLAPLSSSTKGICQVTMAHC